MTFEILVSNAPVIVRIFVPPRLTNPRMKRSPLAAFHDCELLMLSVLKMLWRWVLKLLMPPEPMRRICPADDDSENAEADEAKLRVRMK